MPSFCRHNRFLANCPICSEEAAEGLVTGGSATSPARPSRPGTGPSDHSAPRAPSRRGRRFGAGALQVSHVERSADDGYRSSLVPGLRSSADARKLAEEVAFSVARLSELAGAPPGLYADVAREPEIERACELAFLIAYLSPLEDLADPWRSIRAAAASEPPAFDDGLEAGPRGAFDARLAARTWSAYCAWAQRAGSQEVAFTGDVAWSAERRFARLLERLALPGFPRAARFDLLVSLGRLGRFDLRAGALGLGGVSDATTVAAKRVFGIGDTLLLERRAAALADALAVELEALDLALYNWAGVPARTTLGSRALPAAGAVDALAGALGV
jgi:hypothetical protein